MKNKILKNNEKIHDQNSRSCLIKYVNLLLISLFVVLFTIIPSFASSGNYELKEISIMAVAEQDFSSEIGYSVLDEFTSPFYLKDHPYNPGDYIFTFSDSYLENYPNGAFIVYSDDVSVLESIQSANSGDGSIYSGFYALDFGYLVGNAFITIPGSLIVKPTILDNLFSIFSGIGSWISSIFISLIGVFWLNGSLTPLGTLSVISLAFAVTFLLISIISRFLRFRG